MDNKIQFCECSGEYCRRAPCPANEPLHTLAGKYVTISMYSLLRKAYADTNDFSTRYRIKIIVKL